MPVVIRPKSHPSRPWQQGNADTSPSSVLGSVDPVLCGKTKAVLQSSLVSHSPNNSRFTASQNGFVYAAINAYHGHHHLVIRPEDVWFAILTQLSLYVNRNAEELRSFFVDHEGKEDLCVEHEGDWGQTALQITDQLSKRIKNPTLKEWIMPSFTTTTADDLVVAAVLMMDSLKAYFSYSADMICGIPSVTLKGTRSDWVQMLQRIEFLPELGAEPTYFKKLLKPVLARFVSSFDHPDSHETKAFWNMIACKNDCNMCGATDFFTGWITAFMLWGPGGYLSCDPKLVAQISGGLELDDARYHSVSIDKVPYGFASVPVTILWTGPGRMVAGSLGIVSMSNGTRGISRAYLENTAEHDVIQPAAGWMMLSLHPERETDESQPFFEFSWTAPADDIARPCICPAPRRLSEEVRRSERVRQGSLSSQTDSTISFKGSELTAKLKPHKLGSALRHKLFASTVLSRNAGRANG